MPKRFLIATVVVMVILVIVFIATRTTPAPVPLMGPCSSNYECPAPTTCVKGVCTDLDLTNLLTNAQIGARTLLSWLRVAQLDTSVYSIHLARLQNDITSLGLSDVPPSMVNSLTTDIGAVGTAARNYSALVTGPNGYATLITGVTPSSSLGEIFAASSMVSTIVAPSLPATSSISPLVSDLKNIIFAVNSDATAKGVSLSSLGSWTLINADLAEASGLAAQIANAVSLAQQTGNLLYNHLIMV
jgi:hypothetical protein